MERDFNITVSVANGRTDKHIMQQERTESDSVLDLFLYRMLPVAFVITRGCFLNR